MGQPSLVEPEIFAGFPKGSRFGLWVRPGQATRTRGLILAIQTPGEENNLARRTIVAAARHFAEAGFVILLFDPFGVGDSDGDTVEASLQDWRADLMRIAHLMRQRHDLPFLVWGLRLGSLLAADLLISQSDTIDGVLMWAPLAHGRTWVDHLQRGNTLSRMIRSGRPVGDSATAVPSATPASVDSPSAADNSPDASVLILGGTAYQRSLIDDIRRLSLNPASAWSGYGLPARIAMFGLQSAQDPLARGASPSELPPALQTMASHWRSSGFPVHARALACEPFWASQMPVDAPDLFEQTLAWLEERERTVLAP